MSKATDLALRNVEGLFSSSELLSVKPEDLAPEEALMVWSLFDVLEKEIVKKRKDVFRTHLMELAKDKGERNSKGSFIYNPPHSDGRVTAQKRKGKTSLAVGLAEDLIAQKGLEDTLMVGTLTAPLGLFKSILECARSVENPNEKVTTAIEGLEFTVDEKRLEGAFAMELITPEELRIISREDEATYALVVKKPSAIGEMVKGRKA